MPPSGYPVPLQLNALQGLAIPSAVPTRIRLIEDNEIDWPTFNKATHLKERVSLTGHGKLEQPERVQEIARSDMAKIHKKIPDTLSLANDAGISPGSGEEVMVHSYFHPKYSKGIIIQGQSSARHLGRSV